ncbi:hypothetical protein H257_10689 [Aphanomyces astaci]|uniref:Cell division cycle protein 123 n=2 Tax=Aphanomyces astaci TaxID=112090 RepID=W4G630_APHAT|nr:hypothetical protein H257_10689 [Aphanomyces astaci]ETV75115.1 hypothetical protein H257_10689 [Aphanomyces astaci]|eukprot:XP_009835619.1 hypothetical protein H257_10689 [Aphanomyces astaci]
MAEVDGAHIDTAAVPRSDMASTSVEYTVQQVDNCRFTSWYEALRVHSIRSIAIPLPEEFVASLLQDQILVQEDLYPSSFVAAVKDAIHRLGGRVFAKLDWSSAKDAKWILANSLCCRSFADILMLLKASDFITHDLTQAYDGCSDVGTKRRPDTFHLVLKKWCHLFDSMHFRCFVRAKKLLGISQRNCTERYDFLASEATQDTLCDAIAAFFESHLTTSQALPDPNYVFDVYVDKDHKVHLIDINVFGAVTDPLLFSWDELKQPATAEDERIHFRVVTTPRSAMYSDPYGQYRVPVDLVEHLATPGGFDEFIRQVAKDNIQHPHDDDDDDDHDDDGNWSD